MDPPPYEVRYQNPAENNVLFTANFPDRKPETLPPYPITPHQSCPYPIQPHQPCPYPVQLNQPINLPPQTQQPAVLGIPQTILVMPAGPPSNCVFGQEPMRAYCMRCNREVFTDVEKKIGATSWLFCFFLAAMGLILGCCLIPFCVEKCKDSTHHCPECRNFLGKDSRF